LIESWFGLDLATVKIPPFYVEWIKASDIQHIEVVTGGEGVLAYVNGKPTPYLAWDEESLLLTADLLEAFGIPNIGQVKSALPWIRRLGLDLIVQMPLADDATIIPYRDPAGGLMTTTAAPEFEDPGAEIKLAVSIDENGVPSVAGLSALVLEPLLGFAPALDPATFAPFRAAGIEKLTVKTRGDGLFIIINDRPLPNIAWSKDHLMNAIDVYAEMNEASWVANEPFVEMVRELILQTANSDIELSVMLE
jgi:hypothetical protein